ncbi:virion structural protein [Acaryochloris phage A-HIS1]|nr:virion structural protein [Acaryochloris phage A-HIS1]
MTVNYAAVEAVANRVFQEPVSDLIARSNPVLAGLTKREVGSDRVYVKFKSESDHGAGPIADGTDIVFSGTEGTTRQSAILDWTTYIGKFSVAKRALSQLKDNPGMLGMLLQDEINDAAKDLADSIAAAIFADGTAANSLTGFAGMIADDNTYAGVDRTVAANANWRAAVIDNQIAGPAPGQIGTDVLFNIDQAYFNLNKYGLRDQSAGRQYVGFCSPEILDRYSNLFTQINLSDLANAHFVNQANATGNLGETAVSWMNIPIMRDANNILQTGDLAGSGRFYFFDMSQVFLATLGSSEEAEVHQRFGAQTAPIVDGINFEIELLGNSGEVVQGYVKAYVQLVTDAPKRAGALIKNISLT